MSEKRNYNKQSYEYGSTVRKKQPELTPVQPIKKTTIKTQQQLQKAHVLDGSNIFSLLFLIGAITVTMITCLNYLKVQSDVVQLSRDISSIERDLISLEKENDALEMSLNSEQPDLEMVYEMAVGVLGMVYPNNNEIIYYEYEDEGYYRQYHDIPEQ